MHDSGAIGWNGTADQYYNTLVNLENNIADDRGPLYVEINPELYTGIRPLTIKVMQR